MIRTLLRFLPIIFPLAVKFFRSRKANRTGPQNPRR